MNPSEKPASFTGTHMSVGWTWERIARRKRVATWKRSAPVRPCDAAFAPPSNAPPAAGQRQTAGCFPRSSSSNFPEHFIIARDERCLCWGPRSSRVEPAWFRPRFPTRPPTREGGRPLEPRSQSSSALSLPPLISIVFRVGCGGGTRCELGHFPDMILVTKVRSKGSRCLAFTCLDYAVASATTAERRPPQAAPRSQPHNEAWFMAALPSAADAKPQGIAVSPLAR